jgi:hypothetical protein
MCAFIKSIIGPVIGGVISASVGLGMFFVQRRLTAKDDFIGMIDDLRAKLHVSGEKEHIFYSESMEVLRQGVYKVRRYLSSERRVHLHEILRSYEDLKRWFKAPEDVVVFKVHTHIAADAALGNYLDRFEDCVAGRRIRPDIVSGAIEFPKE